MPAAMTRLSSRRVTPGQAAALFAPDPRDVFTTVDVRTLRDVRRQYPAPGTLPTALGQAINAAQISKYLLWAALGIGSIVVLAGGFMVWRQFKKGG